MLVYIFATNQVKDSAQHTHLTQMQRASERVDTSLNQLELLATLWGQSTSMEGSLQTMDLTYDAIDIRNIYRSLTALKSTNEYIGEVYLYLNNQHALVSDTFGIQKELTSEELAIYQKLTLGPKDMFWTGTLEVVDRMQRYAPTALVVRIPAGIIQSPAVLIIMLGADAFDDLIAELDITGSGAALLIEDRNRLLSAGRHSVTELPELEQELLQEVTQMKEPGGNFTLDSRRWGEHAVTYGEFNRLGISWTFVSATSTGQITGSVTLLSRIIMIISCLMILISILLAWMTSKQLNQPVQRIVKLLRGAGDERDEVEEPADDEFDYIDKRMKHLSHESFRLQGKLDQQLPKLRQGFLLQLLQGHLYALSEEEIRERLEQYGWDTENKRACFMMIQLHGMSNLEGKFSEGDEQLVTFAAANIADEVAQLRNHQVESIHFQDLTFGLLIPFCADSSMETIKTELFHLADEIMTRIHYMLKLQVAVCIGKPVAFDQLHDQVAVAKHALHYKTRNEPTQIIDRDDLLMQGEKVIQYPFHAEKELVLSLRIGNEPQINEMLEIFYRELSTHAPTELHVRQGILQLYGNLTNMILRAGFIPNPTHENTLLFEYLIQLQDPAAMFTALRRDLIIPYMEQFSNAQHAESKRLAERTRTLIHDNYMNDLSLEACADLYGTSPKKLSICFKQVTGSTFIDYLTNYRLERAKELMKETTLTINEIAEAVGYQPTYFHRLFKKHAGLTPGQYREL
jgi:AraC-like DNA-binding protein/ribosomal protein L12E/L44/L45/RPP1/RPP2